MLALAFSVLIFLAEGCDDDSDAPPFPDLAAGQIDLANEDVFLTVRFAPGDIRPGGSGSIAAGDFNADGFIDLLLGAPYADGPDDTRPDAGEAYVLFGPLSGQMDLATMTPDVTIFGAITDDKLGDGVAAGDLNGDGVDDIIVGAPDSNALANLRTDLGEVYIVFGGTDLPKTVDTLAVEQDSGLLAAEGFSHLGAALVVGDVNGDGIDDLVAGAPFAGREPGSPVGSPRTTVGEVYVVYGSSTLGEQISVANRQEDALISGLARSDQFGMSVALGDINGDGDLDIIVGARGYDPDEERSAAGAAFVFFGGEDFPARSTLEEADLVLEGSSRGDFAGTRVAAADLNRDGAAEVIVAAPGAFGKADAKQAAGRLFVVEVENTDTPVILTPDTATVVYGSSVGEFFPTSTAAFGNLIAAGSAHYVSDSRSEAGVAYLVPFPDADGVDLAKPSDEITAILGREGDGLGYAVSFVDLDADGIAELLIQAAGPGLMGGSGFRGSVYGVKLN